MLFFFNNYASGLSLYYFVSTNEDINYCLRDSSLKNAKIIAKYIGLSINNFDAPELKIK